MLVHVGFFVLLFRKAFCEQLLKSYENSEDKGDFVSFEEAAKMCGVDLDAVQD